MHFKKEEIAKKIKQELLDTKDNIVMLKELTKPIAPDCAIGRVSRMDSINNRSINEAALKIAETKLGALTYALSRIDDADFGFCAKCEQAIPIGRIMLVPHSRFCANCAD